MKRLKCLQLVGFLISVVSLPMKAPEATVHIILVGVGGGGGLPNLPEPVFMGGGGSRGLPWKMGNCQNTFLAAVHA